MSIRILSIRFSDSGEVTIDWVDEAVMKPTGGTIHSSYFTPEAIAKDAQVEYWTKELMQDVDELLGHVRKMLE